MSVSRRFNSAVLFLALAACGPLAARAQKPACATGTVQTQYGPVCGTSSSVSIQGAGSFTASAYLGMPYAQPPVGSQRWQNPSAPSSWTATFQATAYGNRCPQAATIQNNTCSFTTSDQNEDCLYLNVWAPSGATSSSKLPVLVFIHGGAFVVGSGGSADTSHIYDGTYLAASQNAIVVTFNYRLGALGFLATSDMQSGINNFGFRDQLMALSWVQKNIGNFGGDPAQVTLFGESAGAMSVGLHALSSSQSSGLFKAALMESNPLGLPYKTLSQAQTLGQSYESLFNCSSLSCLTNQSACNLVAQETSTSLIPIPAKMSSMLPWTPVLDGSLLSGQPMSNLGNLKVPVLMGTNQDEGVLFAALTAQDKPALVKPLGYSAFLSSIFGPGNLTKIQAKSRYACGVAASNCTQQMANVITDFAFTCANRKLALQVGSAQNLYMYLFNQISSFNFWPQVSACDGKVCHGDELPYVFNTAGQIQQSFTSPEETLSQTMGGYWAGLAKSQNPGSSWPLFKNGSTYMMLNANPSTASDPLNTTANCAALWDGIGYENATTWTRLLSATKTAKKPAH